MRNVVIILLLALVVFMGYRVAHLENQRYALMLGMCDRKDGLNLPDFGCLETVQTRTHWAWNVYYGLFKED